MERNNYDKSHKCNGEKPMERYLYMYLLLCTCVIVVGCQSKAIHQTQPELNPG